jgi:ABC-type dipeptide/oligopeptide/nickel transport system permease subunit
VLFLLVLVSGFAPAPVDSIAMFALLAVFLPQFPVAYKLGSFSPDVGSMHAIVGYTVIFIYLGVFLSLLYALLVRWTTRRVRRYRHVRDESRASI